VSDDLELTIDRTRCDGSRLCAELLPERIRLDDWGYPMIAPGAIPAGLLPHARRAVAACPLLALSLRPPTDKSVFPLPAVLGRVGADGGTNAAPRAEGP
jgi:ferredoxin